MIFIHFCHFFSGSFSSEKMTDIEPTKSMSGETTIAPQLIPQIIIDDSEGCNKDAIQERDRKMNAQIR